MPQYNLLDTDTVTLNSIFNNGIRYQVPEYQRDYSWDEEQWDAIWKITQITNSPYAIFDFSLF